MEFHVVELEPICPVPGNVQILFPKLNPDHATAGKPAGKLDGENPCSAGLIQDAFRVRGDFSKHLPFPPEVESKRA